MKEPHQQQVPETPTMQQQFISQGLKKLQEYLVNFRIEESSSGDLYVYTRKNEIFLLRLEEVYEIPNENVEHNANDSVNMGHGQHAKSVKVCTGVSRRPSYASADFESKFNQGHRSQNPSGGSTSSTATTITGKYILNWASQYCFEENRDRIVPWRQIAHFVIEQKRRELKLNTKLTNEIKGG